MNTEISTTQNQIAVPEENSGNSALTGELVSTSTQGSESVPPRAENQSSLGADKPRPTPLYDDVASVIDAAGLAENFTKWNEDSSNEAFPPVKPETIPAAWLKDARFQLNGEPDRLALDLLYRAVAHHVEARAESGVIDQKIQSEFDWVQQYMDESSEHYFQRYVDDSLDYINHLAYTQRDLDEGWMISVEECAAQSGASPAAVCHALETLKRVGLLKRSEYDAYGDPDELAELDETDCWQVEPLELARLLLGDRFCPSLRERLEGNRAARYPLALDSLRQQNQRLRSRINILQKDRQSPGQEPGQPLPGVTTASGISDKEPNFGEYSQGDPFADVSEENAQSRIRDAALPAGDIPGNSTSEPIGTTNQSTQNPNSNEADEESDTRLSLVVKHLGVTMIANRICPQCKGHMDVPYAQPTNWIAVVVEGTEEVLCQKCLQEHAPILASLLDNLKPILPSLLRDLDPSEHFSVCPECGRCDGFLNVGKQHWFCCERHKLKWSGGCNLLSGWRYETEEDWQKNYEQLSTYTEIENDTFLEIPFLRCDRDLSEKEKVVEKSVEVEAATQKSGSTASVTAADTAGIDPFAEPEDSESDPVHNAELYQKAVSHVYSELAQDIEVRKDAMCRLANELHMSPTSSGQSGPADG